MAVTGFEPTLAQTNKLMGEHSTNWATTAPSGIDLDSIFFLQDSSWTNNDYCHLTSNILINNENGCQVRTWFVYTYPKHGDNFLPSGLFLIKQSKNDQQYKAYTYI